VIGATYRQWHLSDQQLQVEGLGKALTSKGLQMGGEGARVAGSANSADPGTLEGKKPTVRGSRFIHSRTPSFRKLPV